ncbi:MAG TPA: hypothetical protein VFC63_18460 [Blastocatellia bacterium]|nr:hypothetical protein [Blastocatellia bacterium]
MQLARPIKAITVFAAILLGFAPVFRPASAVTQATPASGRFRVTLNGFRVNHESDDDILEGDGRGDEIFITTNLWSISADGTAHDLPGLRTKVMGDNRGRPDRILAGSGTPNSTRILGGLRTGDGYPTLEPWRRTGPVQPDHPPMVLWEGTLTDSRDGVVILPIVWEWDSPDRSASQASIERGLPLWFEGARRRALFGITPLGSATIQVIAGSIDLSGKAGTRPIGYVEADSTHSDQFTPQAMMLTYNLATLFAPSTAFSVKGVLEIRYVDKHDHGDYSLYLQVEQIATPTIPRTKAIRP